MISVSEESERSNVNLVVEMMELSLPEERQQKKKETRTKTAKNRVQVPLQAPFSSFILPTTKSICLKNTITIHQIKIMYEETPKYLCTIMYFELEVCN